MIWWLVVTALGVLGIANAILNRLRQTAAAERQRWERDFRQVENQIKSCDQQIQQKIARAQYTVDFHVLTQLHFESMKVANQAYGLLKDARIALDAIGQAIKEAGEQRNRLIAEKRRTWNPFRSSQLEQEISALIELRNQLSPDKDALKAQRDHFLGQVQSLNARTHALKIAIRDRCGAQGLDWYNRLEERTDRRRRGLPATAGEARVRGKVKWYNASKGYGFITPNNGGKDVHVGQKNLRGIRALTQGDLVEFSVRQGKKGPWAKDVSKVR